MVEWAIGFYAFVGTVTFILKERYRKDKSDWKNEGEAMNFSRFCLGLLLKPHKIFKCARIKYLY